MPDATPVGQQLVGIPISTAWARLPSRDCRGCWSADAAVSELSKNLFGRAITIVARRAYLYILIYTSAAERFREEFLGHSGDFFGATVATARGLISCGEMGVGVVLEELAANPSGSGWMIWGGARMSDDGGGDVDTRLRAATRRNTAWTRRLNGSSMVLLLRSCEQPSCRRAFDGLRWVGRWVVGDGQRSVGPCEIANWSGCAGRWFAALPDFAP